MAEIEVPDSHGERGSYKAAGHHEASAEQDGMAADITDKYCAKWRDEHGAAEFEAADQCEVEGRSFREVVVREVIREVDAVRLTESV